MLNKKYSSEYLPQCWIVKRRWDPLVKNITFAILGIYNNYGPPIIALTNVKWLVSALLKSYRHHLLSDERYHLGEGFGNFWASSGGN